MIDSQEQNRTPEGKFKKYADEILEGKYTFESLKNDYSPAWVQGVKSELESRGLLVIEDSPAMREVSVEEPALSSQEIVEQINQAENMFLNETDNAVSQAEHVTSEVPPAVINEAKQETKLPEKIESLKEEAKKEFNEIKDTRTNSQKTADMAKEFFDLDMNLVNNNANKKYEQYAQEILSGKSREQVLQGASKTMVDNVERILAEHKAKKDSAKDEIILDINKNLDPKDNIQEPEKTIENPEEKIEEMKEILSPLVKKIKDIEGSLDDRYRKTDDPMFAPDFQDGLQDIANKFDNAETVEDIIDTTKKMVDLFTEMNESKDYYSKVHDYNGNKQDELKNIESVYYELEDVRDLIRKTLMREIPNLGDREQEFGKEAQKSMMALDDMLNEIDGYRRWLNK